MRDGSGAVRLDPRLLCAAERVPLCHTAADIGADHGRLTAWLLQSGRCQHVIASDVSPISRDKARDLFRKLNLTERVTLSAEDGLNAISRPVQAVVMAGLGGKAIARMLRQDADLAGAKLVLSPQTDAPLVRDAVNARGYRIISEHVARAHGRYYLVLSAVPGEQALTPAQRMTGVNLTDCLPGAVRGYLLWQLRVAGEWQGAEGHMYRQYLKEALADAESDGAGGPGLD